MDLINSGHHDQNQYYLLSKIAMSNQHAEHSPYFEGWKAYNSDPFDTLHNPNGVIQMGLSENKLSLDLIQEWILKNPRSSICTFEGLGAFKDVSIFQDYHGLSEFRNAIARFMGRVMGQTKVSFDPNRIVMGGGATGASELLMFCLADGGDAFLVPTPYYPAFDRDLRWRTNLQLIPVICSSSNNFQITIEALEEAYEKAIRSNIKVKGLILSNPSNPLGTVLNISTLKSLLSFVTQKNIHLVCDEIYAGTVFKKPRFVSVSEALLETEGVNKNLVHIIYSLSKDLGLTGFRVGIVYSYNDYVVNSARRMSSFGLVSTQTQYLIASMLLDDGFVDGFLDENTKRLGSRHKLFIEGLMGDGIKCLESNAGLFCWMDLRHMLKGGTTDEEIGLWRVIINQVKLNISPGSSFHCSEPGWFRVCFANIDIETVKIALKRFGKFVRDDRVNKERDLKIAKE